MRYRFWGLIFGGAYFWNFTVYCYTTVIFLLQQYASGAWKNCPFHFRHEVPVEEYDYHLTICEYKVLRKEITGKNNRFPFLDILGYLKNTHKNPKFGRVRQVPIRELSWEFPGWDLSHFAKFGIFMRIL